MLRSLSRAICRLPRQCGVTIKRQTSTPAMTRIGVILSSNYSSVNRHDNHLEFTHEGSDLKVNYHWLRDNCQCSECYNHKTDQKDVMYFDIDPDIKPENVTKEVDSLNVTWPDGHQSSYNLKWLVENNYVTAMKGSTPQKYFWNKELLKAKPTEIVNYKDFMNEDECVKIFLNNLLLYGHTFLDGVPATVDGTQKASERVSFIHRTTFGDMWAFTSDGARPDTAFTTLGIGAHTDMTYYRHTAGVQVFHCLSHDGNGGETLLVDGFYCAEQLRQTDPKAYELLCNQPIHHQFIDRENREHIKSLATVLQLNPLTKELVQLRWNNYDRCPLSTMPHDVIPDYYKALVALNKQVMDPDNEFWIKLTPGKVVYVDNMRNMHGRSSFDGKRVVCGNYYSFDDWMAKARHLQLTS